MIIIQKKRGCGTWGHAGDEQGGGAGLAVGFDDLRALFQP